MMPKGEKGELRKSSYKYQEAYAMVKGMVYRAVSLITLNKAQTDNITRTSQGFHAVASQIFLLSCSPVGVATMAILGRIPIPHRKLVKNMQLVKAKIHILVYRSYSSSMHHLPPPGGGGWWWYIVCEKDMKKGNKCRIAVSGKTFGPKHSKRVN
jgi:hypothetical protein